MNDVPEAALIDAGYRMVVGAASDAGWSVAAREQGDALFVLCQGHPEYGTLSLLREYRRDVRRSLFGRGAVPYPRLPDGYLGEEAVEILTEFERRASATRHGSACSSGQPSRSRRSRRRSRTRGHPSRPRCTRTGCSWLGPQPQSARMTRAAPCRGVSGSVPPPDPPMHDETLAIHGGYTPDSTRAVAVPIYQTVAHDFIDADHAGAIMDLETPGFHYNRINNPTVDVLEQRVTALEGGAAAMAVSSGATAVSMSLLNLLERRRQLRLGPDPLRSHLHLLRPCASPARDRGPLLGRRPARSRSRARSTSGRKRCSARRSATRPAT